MNSDLQSPSPLLLLFHRNSSNVSRCHCTHADLVFLQSILDCSEANEGFYVKCGFKRAGLEMAHYY